MDAAYSPFVEEIKIVALYPGGKSGWPVELSQKTSPLPNAVLALSFTKDALKSIPERLEEPLFVILKDTAGTQIVNDESLAGTSLTQNVVKFVAANPSVLAAAFDGFEEGA